MASKEKNMQQQQLRQLIILLSGTAAGKHVLAPGNSYALAVTDFAIDKINYNKIRPCIW
jgi:hypothetical protein